MSEFSKPTGGMISPNIQRPTVTQVENIVEESEENKVKSTITDTTPKYLRDAILNSSDIAFLLSVGPSETLTPELSATGVTTGVYTSPNINIDTKGRIIAAGNNYAVATGTDNYAATVAPAITAYATGQQFVINFANANTGVSTLNINGLGAKNLLKIGSTALHKGDITSGQSFIVVYDGTNFQLVGHTAKISQLYITGPNLTFIPGYAGTATTWAYPGGLSTSVHLGSGANQQATRVISFRLPDNFIAFKEIHIGTYRFGAVDSFTVTLKKTPAFPHASSATGTDDATLVAQNVLPVPNDTHVEWAFVPTGSYSPNDTVALVFNDQVDNGEYAEVSFVELHFYTK